MRLFIEPSKRRWKEIIKNSSRIEVFAKIMRRKILFNYYSEIE